MTDKIKHALNILDNLREIQDLPYPEELDSEEISDENWEAITESAIEDFKYDFDDNVEEYKWVANNGCDIEFEKSKESFKESVINKFKLGKNE